MIIKLSAAVILRKSRLGTFVTSLSARVWLWAARWPRWVWFRATVYLARIRLWAACWLGRVGLRATIKLRWV